MKKAKYDYFNPVSDNEADKLLDSVLHPERKKEDSLEGIDKLLKKIKDKINNKYGPPDVISDNGAIIENSDNEERKRRKEERENLKSKWKKNNESFNEFEERIEKKDGIIWEKIVTVIFNKILDENYIIVHSSEHDDLDHGIDTVIINKTGDIIGTLDEVESNFEDKKYNEKINKLKSINEAKGATLDDGLELKNGRLINKKIENIPIFLLQISKDDFHKVLGKMDITSEIEISDVELEIFDKLIKSLLNQIQTTLKENLLKEVRKNVKSFSKSLEDMIKIRDEKFKT